MNRSVRFIPWLLAAMLIFVGVGQVRADEAGGTNGPSIQVDKTVLDNGGTIKVTGQAPAGQPVFLEIWNADKQVKASRFDNAVDKKTGKRPYIFYLTTHMPAYYKIVVPSTMEDKLKAAKKDAGWSFSKLLKDLGANVAYTVPAAIQIERYQSTIMASILGTHGDLLPTMDAKENVQRSMQLVKSRFRSVGNVLDAAIDQKPDGTFTATIKIRDGIAPGNYKIMAVTADGTKSAPATFENKIAFPIYYLDNAGTSLNLIYPFLLTLVVSIFGVLMGAGGGFILNPLLVSIFPALPHTIVAGTVTPTVLFSQGSGIINYSKIKFINWKLGCGIGFAMLLGGFIGPKLTEMITLSQFKFAFGWILLVLAGLMFWQTTPGYLAKNKKEKSILQEFKRRAQEAAKDNK